MSATDTMPALTRTAATRHGDTVAARYVRDGDWHELTYAELWEQVHPVALGLVDLGIELGDRVAILANTRLEFTVADLAVSTIGAIVVPVYPTNSSDECEWVVGNSGAKAIICEDAAQVAKIDAVRSGLPELQHTIVMDGTSPGTVTMAEIATRGRDGDDAELDRRIAAATPDDACLIIYTSGTTGRPKGVVLTNRGFAAGRDSATEMDLIGPGDVVYLYLPLAHIFAQLIQAIAIELGATTAYFSGDTRKIVEELGEVRPTVLPSVPRIFEKVYALAMGLVPPGDEERVAAAVDLGYQVREARRLGQDVSAADAEAFEKADQEIFALVRGIFGGNVQLAISGAAPIAPDILRFFYAAGVPVMEGWGMTETTAIGTFNLPDAFEFGSIGKAVAGADVRIAEDGEIEIGGDILLKEYWDNPTATAETLTEDGYLKTGDLGSIDAEGFVHITGRKKDIIITAGGKNLTPANLEGDLRQSRWISAAIMYGDRKPYPVALITLDAEEIAPWAAANGLPAEIAELARHDTVVKLIQDELDAANGKYAQVEQIKRFTILDRDFTQEAGELTPTLKLKRNVIYENYADEINELYS
jgi:long-chain acyl-CoA synthetase